MLFVPNAARLRLKCIRHSPKKSESHGSTNLILPRMILHGCEKIFLTQVTMWLKGTWCPATSFWVCSWHKPSFGCMNHSLQQVINSLKRCKLWICCVLFLWWSRYKWSFTQDNVIPSLREEAQSPSPVSTFPEHWYCVPWEAAIVSHVTDQYNPKMEGSSEEMGQGDVPVKLRE